MRVSCVTPALSECKAVWHKSLHNIGQTSRTDWTSNIQLTDWNDRFYCLFSCTSSTTHVNKRNKLPPTQLVSVLSLTWQHFSTSEGHLQVNSIKPIECILYSCKFWIETSVQNLTQLYRVSFTSFMLLAWRNPLRSKHVATLKIQHLVVVLTAFYFPYYYI